MYISEEDVFIRTEEDYQTSLRESPYKPFPHKSKLTLQRQIKDLT